MACPFAVHFRVYRDGELFLSNVLRGTPLVLGPDTDATIPTTALTCSLPLLTPGPEGYGLRLMPALLGRITTGGRTLRILDGLLVDPRPEPLVLDDGASGEITLSREVSLCFSVHRQQHRFRRWSRPDGGLCVALSLAFALAGAVVLSIAPWDRQTRVIHEKRLSHRPRALRLARYAPKKTTASRPNVPKARAKSQPAPRRVVGQTKRHRRVRSRERGVLALLGQRTHRQPLDRGGENRLLSQLERSLASTTASLGAGTPGPMGDRLPGLLGDPEDSGQSNPIRLALPPTHRPIPPEKIGSEGRPSREAIRKVVLRNGGQIRLCYEREMLSTNRAMEGRLLLRWVINGQGKVTDLSILSDSVNSNELRACVTNRIRTWIFPGCRIPGGCAVVYPFEFFPSGTTQS